MTSQRIGGKDIYGTGADGNVVITSNVTLSRDMYYDNLLVGLNGTLNPNGFRIFVKNTLTLNGNISAPHTISTGTVSGSPALAAGNISASIGGNSGGNTYIASSLSDSYKKDIINLITGTVTTTSGVVAITGGASGANGANGVVTANTAGGAGSLNRNPLVPGGPGTPGTAVSTIPAGGTGGRGGPVVLICARNITGSGYIITTGAAATAGANAVTMSNGNAAPSAQIYHYADGSAHYRTGDGTHGPHASLSVPNLPHGGHVPHTYNYRHGYTYHHVHRGNVHHSNCSGDCGTYCGGSSTGHYNHGHAHGGGDYGHHSGDYNNSHHIDTQLTGTYYAISGVNHTPGHRGNIGEARIGESSHTSGYYHHGHGNPHHSSHNPGHGGKLSCGAWHNTYYYPVHHWQRDHGTYIYRNAGSYSHESFEIYPGGTKGIGGSATAGANGISGGGGGIIMIGDSIANTVLTSVTGGSGASSIGGSGQVIKIINQ